MNKLSPKQGNSIRVKILVIGSAVLLLSYFLVEYLIWRYSTFYLANYDQFKQWFPERHAIVFPVVKVLPFLILVALFVSFRNFIGSYVVALVQLFKLVMPKLWWAAQRAVKSVLQITAWTFNYLTNQIKKIGSNILHSIC